MLFALRMNFPHGQLIIAGDRAVDPLSLWLIITVHTLERTRPRDTGFRANDAESHAAHAAHINRILNAMQFQEYSSTVKALVASEYGSFSLDVGTPHV